MKKLMLSFLLTLTTPLVFAQTTDEAPIFWFGPKVGVDLAKPTLEQNQIRSEVESNYQYGFFLQFGRKLYIQPELYYATQKEAVGTSSSNFNTVNSLRLPVMLGMRLLNLKVVSAHIMAGPTASYVLGEKSSTSTAITFNRDKLNFALQGGAGVDVFGLITLDVRYSVDLNDNVKQQFQSLSINNGVNVTLGIKLR